MIMTKQHPDASSVTKPAAGPNGGDLIVGYVEFSTYAIELSPTGEYVKIDPNTVSMHTNSHEQLYPRSTLGVCLAVELANAQGTLERFQKVLGDAIDGKVFWRLRHKDGHLLGAYAVTDGAATLEELKARQDKYRAQE